MPVQDSRVLFASGLSANFPASPNANTLYFLTDTHEIYLGSVRYAFGQDITVVISGSGDTIANATWDAATKTLTLIKGSIPSVEAAVEQALIDAVADSDILVADEHGNLDVALATGADAGNVTLEATSSGLSANIDLPVADVKSGDQVLALDGDELTATLGLNYDSQTKKIQLLGISDAVIAEINAADFIKDGMVDSVTYNSATKQVTITFNTDAGKEAITIDLSDLIDTYTAAVGGGLALNNGAFSIDNTVTAGKAVADTTLAFGQATNVTVAQYDTHGLITGTTTAAVTLPALPTGSVGTSGTTVVSNVALDSNGLTGSALNISDTAPASAPQTEEVASTKALYAAMLKWDTFGE